MTVSLSTDGEVMDSCPVLGRASVSSAGDRSGLRNSSRARCMGVTVSFAAAVAEEGANLLARRPLLEAAGSADVDGEANG